MTNRALAARTAKRLDAVLALPLARFRRQLTELTLDELSALEQRIALQMVRSRWALGGHGVERHRAHGELSLLARRRAATHQERENRGANAAAPLHLVERETNVLPLPRAGRDEC